MRMFSARSRTRPSFVGLALPTGGGVAEQGAGHVVVGDSCIAMRPCRCQPVHSSQVRGGATGGTSCERGAPDAGGCFHPVNHRADEQGSIFGRRAERGACFLRFIKT
jgi:hypothetical protein